MSQLRLFYFLVRIINSYQQELLWSQVKSCGRPSTPVLWVLVLKAFPFILVINLNNSKIFTKNICAFWWGSCPENGGRHLRMYQTGPRIRILFCLFSKHTASLEFSLLASMCLLIYIFFLFHSASIHSLWPLLFIQFKIVLLEPQYFEFNDKDEYKALHEQVTLAM